MQYRIYPVEHGRSTDTYEDLIIPNHKIRFAFNRSPLCESRSMAMRRSSSIYCDQPTCYYFLTQCWIEPQDGFVDTNCPELEFLNQCTYKQIVDKVSSLSLSLSLSSNSS